MNLVVGPVISYVAVTMNLTVFILLFSKTLIAPSTVLMQGLAVSDALTAMCMYGLEPLFLSLYRNINLQDITTSKTDSLIDIKYPYCIIHYYSSQLSEIFHLTSVLLTTCLGVQKFIAVCCPIWSRLGITLNKSRVACVICFAVSFLIHFPRLLVISISFDQIKDICLTEKQSEDLATYVLNIYPLLYTGILGLCACLMILSTGIIVFTLCNHRFPSQQRIVTAREKKSSVLIVCILLVFVVTEIPRLLVNGAVLKTYWSTFGESNAVWNKVVLDMDSNSKHCLKDTTMARITIQGLPPPLYFDKDGTQREGGITSCYIKFTPIKRPVLIIGNTTFDMSLKGWISRIDVGSYRMLVDTLFDRMSLKWDKQVHKVVRNTMEILRKDEGCNYIELPDNLPSYFFCNTELKKTIIDNIITIALHLSPYSEQMNYLLTPIWSYMDVKLQDIKLFLEIMKMSTIIGCISNSVIYISMSTKLRTELRNKLCCFLCRTKKKSQTLTTTAASDG